MSVVSEGAFQAKDHHECVSAERVSRPKNHRKCVSAPSCGFLFKPPKTTFKPEIQQVCDFQSANRTRKWPHHIYPHKLHCMLIVSTSHRHDRYLIHIRNKFKTAFYIVYFALIMLIQFKEKCFSNESHSLVERYLKGFGMFGTYVYIFYRGIPVTPCTWLLFRYGKSPWHARLLWRPT
jgi:hypothetical protein